MLLTVNGRGREVPEGTTAKSLIVILGLDPERVAMEIDGDICPRAIWDSVELFEGQYIELVSFVGGG